MFALPNYYTIPQFSFVILTFNEEQHLPRLLNSIAELKAPIFILDSGSTDKTLEIAQSHGAKVKQHAFETHPKQWDFALKTFAIQTPWIIGLDADHVLTPELICLLKDFRNEDYANINGIYFNRKNYFKGKWIRFGGYYPKYLLKMFRTGIGYSDLSELMDHRFMVQGETKVWKKGHLIEENLKENQISFWITKHNRYSDLVAADEAERLLRLREKKIDAKLFGDPNQRTAYFKNIWYKLPRYFRPFLYFLYRMIFQLGFFDGKTGILFHFLQGFWFRLIVDMKIEEQLKAKAKPHEQTKRIFTRWQNSYLGFILIFFSSYLAIYYFNIAYIGITAKGGFYIPFLDNHLNYIRWWRHFSIESTAFILKGLNYPVLTADTSLVVIGRRGVSLVYSCLGYDIMGAFTAFLIAYPKPFRAKLKFWVFGLLLIQAANIFRIVFLSLYWNRNKPFFGLDHHDLFNGFIYILLMIVIYIWLNMNSKKHESNKTQKSI